MATTSGSATVYFGEFVKVFAFLQSCYTKASADDEQTTAARRSFFRNSLTSGLAQIERSADTHTPMLAALIDYVATAGNADGLESVFLTLLGARNAAQDQASFDAGVTAWKKHAAKATVDGVSLMIFYDITSKSMAFFSNDTATSLRTGSLPPFGPEFASSLTAKAQFVISNPYGAVLPPVVSHVVHQHFVLHQLDEEDPTRAAWIAGAKYIGAMMVTAATADELIPIPEPTSKLVGAVVLLAGELIVTAAEGMEFSDKLQQLESRPLAVDPSTAAPPGGLTQDANGNLGVFEMSVDAGPSFDSTVDSTVNNGPTTGGGTENTGTGNDDNNSSQPVDPGTGGGRSTDPNLSGGQSTDPNSSGGQSTSPGLSGGQSTDPGFK